MGEARNRKEAIDRVATAMTGAAADQGKLLELGFYAAVSALGLESLPADRLRHLRLAFMAGAEHVLMSIMNMVDEDREPTTRDIARMEKLHSEIMDARKEMELLMAQAGGRA